MGGSLSPECLFPSRADKELGLREKARPPPGSAGGGEGLWGSSCGRGGDEGLGEKDRTLAGPGGAEGHRLSMTQAVSVLLGVHFPETGRHPPFCCPVPASAPVPGVLWVGTPPHPPIWLLQPCLHLLGSGPCAVSPVCPSEPRL